MCVCAYAVVEVEVRGQPVGVAFLFLPHGLWGSVLVAGTLPAEPSHRPTVLNNKDRRSGRDALDGSEVSP